MAKETAPVRPVAMAVVDATLVELPVVVSDMVFFAKWIDRLVGRLANELKPHTFRERHAVYAALTNSGRLPRVVVPWGKEKRVP